jgi:hypothetical protein
MEQYLKIIHDHFHPDSFINCHLESAWHTTSYDCCRWKSNKEEICTSQMSVTCIIHICTVQGITTCLITWPWKGYPLNRSFHLSVLNNPLLSKIILKGLSMLSHTPELTKNNFQLGQWTQTVPPVRLPVRLFLLIRVYLLLQHTTEMLTLVWMLFHNFTGWGNGGMAQTIVMKAGQTWCHSLHLIL